MNNLFIGAGTLINVFAIVAGATMGGLLGNKFSTQVRELITDVLGLVTLLVGIMSAWVIGSSTLTAAVGEGFTILVLLGALFIGGVVGTWLKVTQRFDTVGIYLNSKFNSGGESQKFIEGFVSASLLFVVGPLAIMGAISDGLGTGLDQLVLKSSLDFFAAAAFAATFGAFGVASSALSVGLYQGAFTALGFVAGAALSVAQVDALTAVGGVLLIGVGMRLLGIKQVKVADLLPALLIAPLLVSLLTRI